MINYGIIYIQNIGHITIYFRHMNAKLKSVQPMHIVKIAMDSTYIWYINYPFPDVGKF